MFEAIMLLSLLFKVVSNNCAGKYNEGYGCASQIIAKAKEFAVFNATLM